MASDSPGMRLAAFEGLNHEYMAQPGRLRRPGGTLKTEEKSANSPFLNRFAHRNADGPKPCAIDRIRRVVRRCQRRLLGALLRGSQGSLGNPLLARCIVYKLKLVAGVEQAHLHFLPDEVGFARLGVDLQSFSVLSLRGDNAFPW